VTVFRGIRNPDGFVNGPHAASPAIPRL
jgi:hypothetical protein